MEQKIRYETPIGSFDTWEEAAQQLDRLDIDPALCITCVYPPVMQAWPYVAKNDPKSN